MSKIAEARKITQAKITTFTVFYTQAWFLITEAVDNYKLWKKRGEKWGYNADTNF